MKTMLKTVFNTILISLFSIANCLVMAQAKGNCETPEYQQFDFWLGQWQVTNPVNNQVRQLWQQSNDKGKTWATLFDGTYAKATNQ
ncbi:hypothetical protein [Thalassotalea sp. ND16A]|uniref:hypothetical protein n=1 Tax=Thalassotalea sp. ND16A TaxID=1535422 RepID=UPI00051A2AC5|nr:hypothetical protein [Thalassotalea sp. ND16A]KGJ98041.1 hypothetical protein ND16A_0846 [Thalassotalea sp. ND16A]